MISLPTVPWCHSFFVVACAGVIRPYTDAIDLKQHRMIASGRSCADVKSEPCSAPKG